MGRKGMEDAVILREAVSLIAEEGLERFSLRGLARRLNIQSASLYNHFASLDELLEQVAQMVIAEMNRNLDQAIQRKEREDAVRALFYAYRKYVHRNPEIYRVVLSLPHIADEKVQEAASQVTEPVRRALEGYHFPEERLMHCQRYLRSLMHGFSTLENRGYLLHMAPPASETYDWILERALEQLERMGEEVEQGD